MSDDTKEFHHHVEKIENYIRVFALLMILLVMTVVAARIDLDHIAKGMNLAVAMLIAVVKAVLVLLIFMHVKDGTRLLWVFSTAAFGWLVLMFIFTFADYSTRGWTPGGFDSPPEANTRGAALEHNNAFDDRAVSPQALN